MLADELGLEPGEERRALSALICAAATSAGIDPGRVRFKRTLRVVRRAVGPAFPP